MFGLTRAQLLADFRIGFFLVSDNDCIAEQGCDGHAIEGGGHDDNASSARNFFRIERECESETAIAYKGFGKPILGNGSINPQSLISIYFLLTSGAAGAFQKSRYHQLDAGAAIFVRRSRRGSYNSTAARFYSRRPAWLRTAVVEVR